MYFSKEDITALERIKRINILNSVSGIKPGNLIGTLSSSGDTNLAIFSSIVHLGSKPGFFGFIVRPSNEIRRDTYNNILETKVFTINHIHSSFVKQAHFTSAKFAADVSEFEQCNLTEEFIYDFKAPFVKESILKIGMKYIESVPIKSTNTLMLVGEVEHLVVPLNAIDDQGIIDLELIDNIGISGLNTYYQLKKIAQFPYASLGEFPKF